MNYIEILKLINTFLSFKNQKYSLVYFNVNGNDIYLIGNNYVLDNFSIKLDIQEFKYELLASLFDSPLIVCAAPEVFGRIVPKNIWHIKEEKIDVKDMNISCFSNGYSYLLRCTKVFNELIKDKDLLSISEEEFIKLMKNTIANETSLIKKMKSGY